jgi:hypothetical protein cdiviTM7_02192
MYSFSLTTFFVGLLIFIAGGSLILWHRWIGDNFVYGVSSYDKIKFWGVIGCILGFFVMLNLHTVFLEFFVKMLFK